jgi:uncharacterized protein (TIGR02284 family)
MEHARHDPQKSVISGDQSEILEDLVTSSRDAGHTYRYASSVVANPEHRRLLLALAARRSELVDILWKPLEGECGEASNDGSTLGALRRGRRWFIELLQGPHEEDLFRDCALAEARALGLYVRALRRNWPIEIRSILEKQAGEIKLNHDRMLKLRGTH